MSGPEVYVFLGAAAVFPLVAFAKLLLEEVISVVVLVKKLMATLRSEYSLDSGKLEAVNKHTQRPL